ncbi:MAG: LysR family transcriptional regulator [Clostridia bacterium]|nr:LysR family transcriptional regulator [Clostridia bacterium]
MNTRQLQYAVLLSRVRSFSQAAESLGISQPALSKQIIALEEELGVKLFDRSTAPLTLTAAGEHFASRAEQLLYGEDQLLRAMEQYRTGDWGRLVIGVSPFRSLYMMPPFIRQLREHFPHLQVVLSEANSAQLHKGVTEGSYDFAIMNLPVDESVLNVIPLEPDELVLAVPESMLKLLTPPPADGMPVDLASCRSLPFVVLSQQQELRQQFSRLSAQAGLEPDIQVEVVGIATAWEMVRAGVGAAVLPRQFVQKDDHPGVQLLPLLQQAITRQPAIVTRRGQYVSRFTEYAIRLLQAT